MSSPSCPQHQTRSRSPAASCQPSHWRDLSTIRSTLQLVPHFPFTHLEIPKAFLVLNCPSHPAFPSIMPFSLIPKVQVFIHSPKVAPPTSAPPSAVPWVCVCVCVSTKSHAYSLVPGEPLFALPVLLEKITSSGSHFDCHHHHHDVVCNTFSGQSPSTAVTFLT